MWKLKSSVDICHACISIHYYSPDHVFMSQAKHIAGSVAGPLQIAVQSSDMLVYLDFTQYYRSLPMSFCWPKTTPIAAPIKSCCQNHMSNSFCCIMHSEAQWAESMAGLIYKDELLPPFIVAWDDFLPVENKQNMTLNLVNNLFKITLFCTNMNGVCNIEGESSRQVAWI